MGAQTGKRVATQIHLSAAQREQLKRVAAANERSMGAEVRYALSRHLSKAGQAT